MRAAIWTSKAPNAKVIRIVTADNRRLLEKETRILLAEERKFNGHPYAISRICGDQQCVGDTVVK